MGEGGFVALVGALLGALLVVLCVADCDASSKFEQHCKARGGHVKTVYGYKDSTQYCLRSDGGIVDVR